MILCAKSTYLSETNYSMNVGYLSVVQDIEPWVFIIERQIYLLFFGASLVTIHRNRIVTSDNNMSEVVIEGKTLSTRL